MDGAYGPFEVPDFWRKSVFGLSDAPEQTLFTNTQFELPMINDHFDTELRLPTIEDFEFGKLDDLSAPANSKEEPSVSTQDTSVPSLLDGLDTLWELDLRTAKNTSLRTWEAFADDFDTDAPISNISEAGPRGFDALQSEDTQVLQSAFTLKCLALLGLGRSSALFQWKNDKKIFAPTIDNVRLSGLSSTAFESVVAQLSTVGTAFIALRQFVQSSYANKNPLASRVALAKSIQGVLEVVDQNMSDRVLNAPSTLQLLAFFDAPTMLLTEMIQLTKTTAHASTDATFLSACHQIFEHFTSACSPFQSLYAEILNQVSRPWFQAICQKTGLVNDNLDVEVLGGDEMLERSAHVSAEDSAQITDLMTGIVVLRNSASDHPLLSPASWGVDQPDLEISTIDVDIDRISRKANKYQQDLLLAIAKYTNGCSKPHDRQSDEMTDHLTSEQLPWSLDQGQQTYFEDVGTQFSEDPIKKVDVSNLQRLTAAILLETASTQDALSLDLRRPTKTMMQHLQPYLHVQTRLLNGTLLRLLFRRFSLREHFNLNHSFHLLGNGLFVQYLTAALFTSEASAYGLRLDNRFKQWPPASSELRLGLMGVLSEAYGSNDIPGSLSFAIRELDDAEIEKCLDANSIHALDFLRLRYEAPAPLDAILDDKAMVKFDDCFRVLLGVLRMLHFVTLLRGSAQQKDSSTASQAFAHEAWSCVSSLASYFFDVGIAGPWKEFQRVLDEIETNLALEDETETFGQRVTFGLTHLRNKHNDMLDTIRSRLLLRSRHNKLRVTIENVFGFILSVRQDGQDQEVLWKQRDTLREIVKGLKSDLQELTRKVGKKKDMSPQDRDDVFAADVLGFRLGGVEL
ncbi:hypothetical protein E4T47_01171 [Aureobasidium subglaciale]|nr:hypothetical protein E4T47_01171 [Aureobasidium subglaciale]